MGKLSRRNSKERKKNRGFELNKYPDAFLASSSSYFPFLKENWKTGKGMS